MTAATRTEYDYDIMLRMAEASCTAMVDGDADYRLNLSAQYTYENDLRSTIQTPSTLYSFEYGSFALRKSVKAGNRTLATYTYTEEDNYLDRLAYGNEDVVQYIYDEKGRIVEDQYGYIEQTEDSESEASVPTTHITDTVTYSYDSDGELAQVKDTLSDITTKYFYDLTNRRAKYTETGAGFSNSVSYSFDLKGNMTKMLQQIGNTERESTYTYDDDNRIKAQVSNDSGRSYSYDAYGRLSSSSTTDDGSGVVEHYYDYEETAAGTTPQVSGITVFGQVDIISYGYTYDGNGNIATASEDGYTTIYTYDSANQLVQVEAPMQDAVWQYTYDDAGNLTSSARYPYGPLDELGMWGYDEYAEYEYNDDLEWGDLLTSYNGVDIEYDAIGNPESFRGWTMQWQHGRQLASMSRNGTTWNFTYNANGLRTKRTSGSKTYTYGYIGDQLWYYKVDDQEFFISWDTSGLPLSITTGGETYYYITNLQGDVTALMDSNGEIVDRYYYTPWGADDWMISYQSTMIGNLNPLRYRGYVYDSETGLYYVSSRYYDPEIGRWINADNVIAGVGGSIQGYNMFAYCFNNPVNMSDPSGNWPKWIETAANWVNKNIIQPVANFFSTSTNTISGQFQEGIFRGSGSLTGGYSELNWRLDDKIKSSGSQDGWVGGFGKASVGNANGKIGIGNNNLSASLKGVADGLVATAQAGLHYKDGFGVGAKAKASVLSGRATTEFNIFGWQVELGVSGELLSIGAEATIGIFPTESGGKEFRMKAGVAPGPYGWGYVVRIKSPY